MSTIQSIRGMHDVLPERSALWWWLEARAREVLESYGYREIRTPIVEHTKLFSRSIGEATDIVEKEMYTFDDRSGESLTLRPEFTAGVVRSGIQHGFMHNQQQRLWYQGPVFRHERPQKGRYRQFQQIGAEVFGIPTADIDAELIFLTARLWRRLGLDNVRLEINTLGNVEARAAHRRKLVDYLGSHQEKLDEDSQRRLKTNPLRVLDSKNPDMQEIVEDAPRLLDLLDDESRAHFDELKLRLDDSGIAYTVNPRLVRGLDYYNRTVFEWVTDALGAQGTVCGGGRYDGLVEQLGGRPTFGTGFSMGVDRLLALVEQQAEVPDAGAPDAYLVAVGVAAERAGQKLAETLRASCQTLKLISNCGAGSFKAQLKRADKSGATLALILGDDEVVAGQVTVKHLRDPGSHNTQITMEQSKLADHLRSIVQPGI